MTEVGHSSGDDGHQPFASGTYAFTERDGEWLMRYAMADPRGLRTSPAPDLHPTSALLIGDVEAAARALVESSFDAVSGPVVDASGEPIEKTDLVMAEVLCSRDSGTRKEFNLDVRKDDNEMALRRILEVWDAAGYSSARAMEEDIRYGETLPVSRMSIRDKSSIDALLHMRIASVCVAGE